MRPITSITAVLVNKWAVLLRLRAMNRTALLRSWAAIALVVLLVAACKSSSVSRGGASQPSLDLFSAPPTESTSTEASQRRAGGIAITVASLPIGGNTDGQGAQQCADVGLTNVPDPLPPDVSISVTGVRLEPDGIFAVGGDRAACGQTASTDEPTCPQTWTWTAGRMGRCVVVVTQIVDSDRGVTLKLRGNVRCSKQSSCNAIKDAGTSQIEFQAEVGVVSHSPSVPDGGESSPSVPGTGASSQSPPSTGGTT